MTHNNKNSVKQPISTAISCALIGLYLLLEGFQIISFGKPSSNTPYWIISLCGAIFIIASLMIMFKNNNHWNDLGAFVICLVMGIIAGWVSIFADDTGMGGSGMWLNEVTGLPINRIVFGMGSIICFLISIYAIKCFKKKYNNE